MSSDGSGVVARYLTAYASGDVAGATSSVDEDFVFRGPMQQTPGKEGGRAGS